MLGFVPWTFSVSLLVLSAGEASAQNYPNKPIRIVTATPGGSGDFVARLIAQGISSPLGQNIVVENRATIVSGELVSKAPPDGYTLLVIGGLFWIGPLLQKISYDPVRDFSPIALLVNTPNILVVHESVPAKSVKELIDLAKARPGALNYASAGAGSSPHLATELFKAMAGVNLVEIPYKGNAAGLNDLIGGQVQVMFPSAATVTPHVKSGRLRALAVTTAQPSALAPGVPTVAATVPGYESGGATAMFAPAGTAATIVNQLNREVRRVLNQTDAKERFFNFGMETVGSSPAELAATIKSEMARLGKVIKDAGIRAD